MDIDCRPAEEIADRHGRVEGEREQQAIPVASGDEVDSLNPATIRRAVSAMWRVVRADGQCAVFVSDGRDGGGDGGFLTQTQHQHVAPKSEVCDGVAGNERWNPRIADIQILDSIGDWEPSGPGDLVSAASRGWWRDVPACRRRRGRLAALCASGSRRLGCASLAPPSCGRSRLNTWNHATSIASRPGFQSLVPTEARCHGSIVLRTKWNPIPRNSLGGNSPANHSFQLFRRTIFHVSRKWWGNFGRSAPVSYPRNQPSTNKRASHCRPSPTLASFRTFDCSDSLSTSVDHL